MILARQVPPEYQQSPLSLGDEFFPDNCAIFGNRNYREHVPDTVQVIRDAMNDYFIPDPILATDWTPAETSAWSDWIRELDSNSSRLQLLCDGLELLTREKWDFQTLTGDCQGDWQYIVYPVADWTPQALQQLETEYFNTGDEWTVDPDGDAVNVYTHDWRADEIRRELAAAYGCDPDELTLQKFTGWNRFPVYEEVYQ